MLFYILILSLLFSQPFPASVHALALDSPADALRVPSLSAKFPKGAPDRPWHDNTCRDPSLGIHLTVAWGQDVPEKYIYKVLQEAKWTFQTILDAGHINELHPKTDLTLAELLLKRELVITTRPYRKYPWSKVILTIRQSIEALSLLERCGWKMRHYKEMWAFIFLGKV